VLDFPSDFAPASVLIEKILRTNPDVGKIYVLIKAKDSETALQRLQNEVW
jgi:fatty acyl-CoA reductase